MPDTPDTPDTPDGSEPPADRLARIRAACEEPDRPPPDRADVAWLLAEHDRLRGQLGGGVTQYAVLPVIDGRPGSVDEYGTEREAVLMRLELDQGHEDPGYQVRILTRQVVTTPWTETGTP